MVVMRDSVRNGGQWLLLGKVVVIRGFIVKRDSGCNGGIVVLIRGDGCYKGKWF